MCDRRTRFTAPWKASRETPASASGNACWSAGYPALQQAFPEALAGVSLDAFHGAVNRVRRSHIRVEADEVTYNLHVALRFELELALFRGELRASELPGAWEAASRR